MELEGQKVLVLGLGMSGVSAARFCAERGARVVAADERPEDEVRELESLPGSVALSLGRPFPDPADYDLVVPSPGVPAARWEGRAARASARQRSASSTGSSRSVCWWGRPMSAAASSAARTAPSRSPK